jgi:LCP family protein required for cell wall assembly
MDSRPDIQAGDPTLTAARTSGPGVPRARRPGPRAWWARRPGLPPWPNPPRPARAGVPAPRRRRTPLWARLIGGAVAILLLLAGGSIGALKILVHRYDSAVHKAVLLDPGARASVAPGTGVFVPATLHGPLNYLLLGSDARAADPSMGQRSDTIIVVHVPVTMDRAYLISIPRDLRVSIPPDPGHGFPGSTQKINAAFNYGGGGIGGFQLMSKTLTRLLGIKFDGAAIINFTGFQRVVGILGGVDMCVDQVTRSIHTGQVYQPGCQHLAPWQALDYVRQRETLPEGDFDRQRHQQQFLKALFEQATSRGVAANPIKLDRILRTVGSALTVDTNGVSLEQLVYSLRSLSAANLVGVRLPSYPAMRGGISYVLPEAAATGLYRAIAGDAMAEWVRGSPSWVNRI